MPSVPLLLLLLPGLLLLTLVEAGEEQQGIGILEASPATVQTEIERSPQLSFNALSPLPEQKISKEERQARRLLRKKKKRLRALRDEIRKMGGIGGGLKTVKLARSRDDKWRRRMLARLDAITRRLDHLETLLVESNTAAKTKNKEAEKTRKMDRHFASISRSLNGEVGMACANHRDCRPGRCCHAAGVTTGAAAAGVATASASASCVRHDAPEADGCADSCQCTLQLQCYAPKDNSTQPACKRATSTDIVTGIYLNDPSAIF